MVNKIALFAASLAASLALAFALAAAGFAPGASEPSAATTAAAATSPTTAEVAPTPRVQVDTVYVAPPAKPRTIKIHKVIKTSGGESEEQESDD